MELDSLDIYILKPKEATNLVTNPSFEKATTGYTVLAGSIARSTTYQRRGRYSLEITPNTGVESGVYFGTVSLTDATLYSFSADVLGVAGHTYRIYFANTSGTMQQATTFVATGYWQRVSVSYTVSGTASRRLYVTRNAVASTAKFYVDGFQCETGNVSSYIDGDLKGFLRNVKDYGWYGTPHASTSYRTATTRHGGEYVNLGTIANLLAIIGLGMTPMKLVSQPIMTGGSIYQKSTMEERDFVLSMLFYGNKFSEIQANRKTLIDLVRPDASTNVQPLTMVIQGKDQNGAENMYPCVIPCIYKAGLEGNASLQTEEVVNLQFRQFFPILASDGENAVTINVSSTFTAKSLIRRKKDGTWEDMNVSGGSGLVYKIKYNPVDGKVYAGGDTTSWNGVSSNGIAVYDPASNTWSAMGTGTGGAGAVYDIDFDASGNVYAVGSFPSMGGAANSANVAKWDIGTSTWTGLNSGLTGSGPSLRSVVIAPDGMVYVGGKFASINGVTAEAVAKYNGTSWSSLSWGNSGAFVRRLLYQNDTLFVLHDVAIRQYISKYDGTTWTDLYYWSQVSTTAPLAMNFNDKGELFVASTKLATLASFTGTGRWVVLPQQLTGWSNIRTVGKDSKGSLFIGGDGSSTTITNWQNPPDNMFEIAGSTFLPIDADFTGVNPLIYSFEFVEQEMWISGYFATANVVTGSVTVQNNSTAATYPTFKITGPGKLWTIRNYTTGKLLAFKDLTLVAGEVVTISLVPGNVYATSSTRGNIMSYFISGADFDFPLVTGTNNISVFMTGTSGNTLAVMYYPTAFWSLDGAIR